MIGIILRVFCIFLISFEILAPASSASASAVAADKIYSVCDIQDNSISNSDQAITIRAAVGRSFHLGVVLTDNRCVGKVVKVIFPIPDPKGVQEKFRFLYASNGAAPADIYFICDCSGHVNFKHRIPELDIDDAIINKSDKLEKLPGG